MEDFREMLITLFILGFKLSVEQEVNHAKITVTDIKRGIEVTQMLPQDHHLEDSFVGCVIYCKDKLVAKLHEINKLEEKQKQ